MMKSKKKFPRPRSSSSRKKSELAVVVPRADNSNENYSNESNNCSCSERISRTSRSKTINSSSSSSRRSRSLSLTPRRFRFGRKKNNNKDVLTDVQVVEDGIDNVVLDGGNGLSLSPKMPMMTTSVDEKKSCQKNQEQQQQEASSNTIKTTISDIDHAKIYITKEEQHKQQHHSSSSPPITRTRSLTPSDIHYHTSPNGGCNASLTPISQHYQTNDALLDLFSTLYETKDHQAQVAYAVGMKFVEVALFTIPSHGYYRSGGDNHRMKSAADAVKVTQMLGGMVNGEIMIGEEDEEKERMDTLKNLASVAQKSFQDALLNDELKVSVSEGSNDDKNEGATSKLTRIWNDYIMGDGPEYNPNLCSLPDNICSFWTDNTNYVDDATTTAMEDNYSMEQHQEEQHVKKKTKIDVRSLPKQPEPIVIPQVFIRKESSDVSMTEGIDDSMHAVAKKEAPETTSGLNTRNAPLDETTSEDTCRPMEVDLITPKTRPSESKTNEAVNCQSKNSLPSALAESEAKTVRDDSKVTKPEPTVPVLQGKPVQNKSMDADSSVFDKDALQLALSLSMSMQENNDYDNVNVVSSSSSCDGIESSMKITASSEEKKNDYSNNKISTLSDLYQEQYHSLRDKNKFHVRFLDTFQGRNPKSTNGCTVIAPLTCIQYFTSNEQNNVVVSSQQQQQSTSNNGIPDDLINQVIDEHAATILPEVRTKLNLEQDSFIIPSDVHDHLIEVGLLDSSQFVGVCGGNILDDDHLSSFKSTLLLLDDERERERLKGRKVAATFFFHGHVIALHVVRGDDRDGNDDVWVDLIDSLPNPNTWINCPPSVSNNAVGCEEREHSSSSQPTVSCWGKDTGEEWETPPMMMEYEDELIQNAVRVRCTDMEHFDTLIRHYAISKFSGEEVQFIDSTIWDDSSSYCEYSFDPRVFQAFIWAEAA